MNIPGRPTNSRAIHDRGGGITTILGYRKKALQRRSLPLPQTTHRYRTQITRHDSQKYIFEARIMLDKQRYKQARVHLLSALDHFPYEPRLIHELAIVDWLDGALNGQIMRIEKFLGYRNEGYRNDRINLLQGLGQARVTIDNSELGIEELISAIKLRHSIAGDGQRRFDNEWYDWIQFNRLDWRAGPGANTSLIRALVIYSRPHNLSNPQTLMMNIGWGIIKYVKVGLSNTKVSSATIVTPYLWLKY